MKKYFKDPYVYVTLNGKVFILNGRGGYTIPLTNERLTILEALAQQNAYEPDDRWDEVLIIREIDGKRTTAFVDLNTKQILNSPYYYLHNNDVIYIKPGKINATLKSTTSIRSTIGLVTGVLALFIILFKKIKMSQAKINPWENNISNELLGKQNNNAANKSLKRY